MVQTKQQRAIIIHIMGRLMANQATIRRVTASEKKLKGEREFFQSLILPKIKGKRKFLQLKLKEARSGKIVSEKDLKG